MSSKRGGSGVGKEVGEIQEQIERLRQKYGMDFDEFFEAVESFSKLKKLMEKYDLGRFWRAPWSVKLCSKSLRMLGVMVSLVLPVTGLGGWL